VTLDALGVVLAVGARTVGADVMKPREAGDVDPLEQPLGIPIPVSCERTERKGFKR
jgi:hypothetical protein